MRYSISQTTTQAFKSNFLRRTLVVLSWIFQRPWLVVLVKVSQVALIPCKARCWCYKPCKSSGSCSFECPIWKRSAQSHPKLVACACQWAQSIRCTKGLSSLLHRLSRLPKSVKAAQKELLCREPGSSTCLPPSRARQLPGPSQERGRYVRNLEMWAGAPGVSSTDVFSGRGKQGRKFGKRGVVSSHVSTASQEPGTLGLTNPQTKEKPEESGVWSQEPPAGVGNPESPSFTAEMNKPKKEKRTVVNMRSGGKDIAFFEIFYLPSKGVLRNQCPLLKSSAGRQSYFATSLCQIYLFVHATLSFLVSNLSGCQGGGAAPSPPTPLQLGLNVTFSTEVSAFSFSSFSSFLFEVECRKTILFCYLSMFDLVIYLPTYVSAYVPLTLYLAT